MKDVFSEQSGDYVKFRPITQTSSSSSCFPSYPAAKAPGIAERATDK